MTIREFANRLSLIKNDLIKNRANEAFLIAKEALALVRRRVQNEGEKSDGTQFGDYSTEPLPAYFFFGKSLNASGAKAVQKAAKSGKGISYKDFRRANNRPTDKIDLTFSGAMWREMEVTIIANDTEKTTAAVTPRTERSKKVAGYNSERYGDILRLSKTEIGMLNAANLERVKKSFRKFLK